MSYPAAVPPGLPEELLKIGAFISDDNRYTGYPFFVMCREMEDQDRALHILQCYGYQQARSSPASPAVFFACQCAPGHICNFHEYTPAYQKYIEGKGTYFFTSWEEHYSPDWMQCKKKY